MIGRSALAPALVAVLVACGQSAWTQEAKEYAHDVLHDFRKGPLSPDLSLFGDKEEKYVTLEPQGLRIKLPRTWIHPFGGVGYRTETPVRGDFEITASYEIMEAETPPKGYGVGVSLRVKKADSLELANITRVLRAGGKQVLLGNRSIEKPGEKPQFPERGIACTDKIGRLRLTRMGTMLHYARAAGLEGEQFEEFHKADFGANDIQYVFVLGHTGREACNLDARFLDLRIRSGAPRVAPAKDGVAVPAPHQPQVAAQAPAPAPTRGWLTLTLLIGLAATVFVALGVGGWLFLRSRRPLEEAELDPGDAEKPAVFACTGCGKKVRSKTSSAGKKIKCPHCGKAVLVPQ